MDIKCGVLHVTQGAAHLSPWVSVRSYLPRLSATCPPRHQPLAHVGSCLATFLFSRSQNLALCSLAMISKASWHESGSSGVTLGRLDFLTERSHTRLINAAVAPHPILSQDQPLREKGGPAELSLGGWLGTEGQMTLGNILRSFPLSPSKDFWHYVYREKPWEDRRWEPKTEVRLFHLISVLRKTRAVHWGQTHLFLMCCECLKKKNDENLLDTPFWSMSTWGDLLVWLYCHREELSLEKPIRGAEPLGRAAGGPRRFRKSRNLSGTQSVLVSFC